MPYQIKGKYIDAGEVINELNVADGTTVWSDFIDDLWWVKRIVIMVSSTTAYRIYFKRKDSEGQEDWGSSIETVATASGSSYASFTYGVDDNKGIIGYALSLGIRNNDGASNPSNIKAKIQFIGDVN